jgi:hypothetical protein
MQLQELELKREHANFEVVRGVRPRQIRKGATQAVAG